MTTAFRFTRYLFSEEDAAFSFQRALLHRQKNEALYWAYELYYSGLPIWPLIEEMYRRIWKTTSPKYEKKINHIKCDTDATGIGAVISTLCSRDPNKPNNEKFTIRFPESSLEPYKTYIQTNICPRKYLLEVTKYGVTSRSDLSDPPVHCCLNNWTYYCYETPYWKTIFNEHGITADHINRLLAFPNDDVLEEFYDKYGYELEEQCLELQKAHGVYIDCL